MKNEKKKSSHSPKYTLILFLQRTFDVLLINPKIMVMIRFTIIYQWIISWNNSNSFIEKGINSKDPKRDEKNKHCFTKKRIKKKWEKKWKRNEDKPFSKWYSNI